MPQTNCIGRTGREGRKPCAPTCGRQTVRSPVLFWSIESCDRLFPSGSFNCAIAGSLQVN
ncbi:hypothetical protein [Coleofasciculus sp. G2-EDA-02]|uniref:hypothetical protein n=1 Tax=Coleofasciculus sp. G2-EDA-02 TaxID=3069529 RepID=UPI0032F8ADC5